MEVPESATVKALATLEVLRNLIPDLQTDEVIFVGSIVLEFLGLRSARDIDIIVTPELRKRLEQLGTPNGSVIDITSEIQLVGEPYNSQGVANSQFFKTQELGSRPYNEYELVAGCRIRLARPELEFGRKLVRSRPKDEADLNLLENYASKNADWDWGLIVQSTAVSSLRGKSPDFCGLLRRVFRRRRASDWLKLFHRQVLTRYSTRAFRRRTLSPQQTVTSSVDVGTLLQWQMRNGHFMRFDMLLRLLTYRAWRDFNSSIEADEEKICLNITQVFEIYRRMQIARIGSDTSGRFEALMSSISEKGYLVDRYPILLSSRGDLLDGSHRLAIAVADGVERVPVAFNKYRNGVRPYGRDWFEERDFDTKILSDLDLALSDVLMSTGAAFQLLIWPPAQEFSDNIISVIEKRYSVLGVKHQISISDFPDFVRAVYAKDDIESWKIAKKLFHMKGYSPIVTAVAFLIDDPRYRCKMRTGSFLSGEVAELKAEIRSQYSHRIPNHFHDIMVHVGDNPEMNRHTLKTLEFYGH